MAHPNHKARARLKRYLKGDGLELGALHMPLDISGCEIKRIRYVDRMPVEDLRTHYPELASLPLVNVDVVDDAERLATVPDGSLDFIIANHLIEHTQNPIAAILCWFQKLKVGGVLYMAVPDKRRTFDVDRPLTPLQHFVDDYYANAEQLKERNREAFYEWVRLVNKSPEHEVEWATQKLIEMDYSIHYHTFTFESMKQLLQEIQQKFYPGLQIAAEAPTAITSNEFIFVLAKEQLPASPSKWGSLSRLLPQSWADRLSGISVGS